MRPIWVRSDWKWMKEKISADQEFISYQQRGGRYECNTGTLSNALS